MTAKEKRQAAVVGLALLLWWLWPKPQEFTDATYDTTPDLTDEEVRILEQQ